jgi:hypothetical protein
MPLSTFWSVGPAWKTVYFLYKKGTGNQTIPVPRTIIDLKPGFSGGPVYGLNDCFASNGCLCGIIAMHNSLFQSLE